jgi:SAM-dependent methyltransferase
MAGDAWGRPKGRPFWVASEHGGVFIRCENACMKTVDFGHTAQDYGRHRAGFPPDFFARVASWGIGLPRQDLLDLGAGTGTVARGFALRGCRVTGLDPARPMLEQAQELDRAAGVSVNYVCAEAEDSGLPDASFDVVSAGQCWHWFERGRAAAECFRLLRGGGSVLIAHFDWLPLPGSVVEATEALICKHNPRWQFSGGTGIYPAWFADLAGAGFIGLESFSFDIDQPYSHEAWRGRIRASAGVAASLDPEAVARFDDEHAALLQRHFAQHPLQVPHRVFALVGRKPGR